MKTTVTLTQDEWREVASMFEVYAASLWEKTVLTTLSNEDKAVIARTAALSLYYQTLFAKAGEIEK